MYAARTDSNRTTQRRDAMLAWLLGAMVASCVTPASSAVAAGSSAPSDPFQLGCGPVRYVDVGTVDYRLKDTNPVDNKRVWNLDHYHTSIAVAELRKSFPYAGNVSGNLDFSLRHSPNHHEALAAMIRWELSRGDLRGFPGARCSLDWAHRFAPDDEVVLQLGGSYFWKKAEHGRAEAWYLGALELRPDYAEAHYNLGLMYVDMKRYDKAREHARLAYRAGFPLPGLRRKLDAAGYPVATADPQQR